MSGSVACMCLCLCCRFYVCVYVFIPMCVGFMCVVLCVYVVGPMCLVLWFMIVWLYVCWIGVRVSMCVFRCCAGSMFCLVLCFMC